MHAAGTCGPCDIDQGDTDPDTKIRRFQDTYLRDLLTILVETGLCSFAICEFMLVRAYIVRVSVK
jgi:hypothetical protein